MNKVLILLTIITFSAAAQNIGAFLPKGGKKSDKYLFYQHGGVVTGRGDMVVNESAPEWGPYEFSNILDALRSRGFHVISEVRQKQIDESFYVDKITKQIDSLFKAGVPGKNIVLVGASAGWDIALRVSSQLKNNNVRYVIMGGCWPNTHMEYTTLALYGHFLSIFETTDPHGSCLKIFEGRKNLRSYKEIRLNTGLSHGFIYKPDRAWINPIVAWLK